MKSRLLKYWSDIEEYQRVGLAFKVVTLSASGFEDAESSVDDLVVLLGEKVDKIIRYDKIWPIRSLNNVTARMT